jgi:hypothetical protein
MAGESRRLVEGLTSRQFHEIGKGVSLMAVLRREDGIVTRKSRSMEVQRTI